MRNNKVRDMVLSSLFAALMVLGAYVSISLPGGVPITFQLFFAMLAGGVIGSKRASIAMLLYIFMGLVGLPVFSEGASGIGVIFKPTFGYIIGFVICAYVVGFIVEKSKKEKGIKKQVGFFIAPFIGLIIDYAIGVPYLQMIFAKVIGNPITFSTALIYGFWPYIILDLIKAFIIVGVIATVVPRLEREELLA